MQAGIARPDRELIFDEVKSIILYERHCDQYLAVKSI